jgi:UDPglucose 6-dehydrogenase
MKINIVGSGFVGAATGKGMVNHGHRVTFLDVDHNIVAMLDGEGYDARLAGDYHALTGEVTMFCVPTPPVHGEIRLDALRAAVESFAELLHSHDDFHVVVVRSTVPPKTTRQIVLPLIEKVSGKTVGIDFGLVMQPEYLREATAEQDFARPWLITIGEFDKKSGDVVSKAYRGFDAPIIRTSLEEAEFQKYVHNVYNAVKIAFFNEMRIVAQGEAGRHDDPRQAQKQRGHVEPDLRHSRPRAVDGSCLPKDSAALVEWGDRNGYSLEIVRTVIAENLMHERLLGRNSVVRNHMQDVAHG